MKKVYIIFIDERSADFEKVINSAEILSNLNSQRKFFEVVDEFEGTFIYKVSEVDSISIR